MTQSLQLEACNSELTVQTSQKEMKRKENTKQTETMNTVNTHTGTIRLTAGVNFKLNVHPTHSHN